MVILRKITITREEFDRRLDEFAIIYAQRNAGSLNAHDEIKARLGQLFAYMSMTEREIRYQGMDKDGVWDHSVFERVTDIDPTRRWILEMIYERGEVTEVLVIDREKLNEETRSSRTDGEVHRHELSSDSPSADQHGSAGEAIPRDVQPSTPDDT